MDTPLEESQKYETSIEVSDARAKEISNGYSEEKAAKKLAAPLYPKTITIKFRGKRDADNFCKLFGRQLHYDDKQVIITANASADAEPHCFAGEEPILKEANNDRSWEDHWVDMPSFIQEKREWIFHKVDVISESRNDYAYLANKIRQYLNETTVATYYPSWSPSNIKVYRWKSDRQYDDTNPQYPVFIISKGRAFSRLTAKSLEEINVPYYMVVEPYEYDAYASVVDPKKILTLPYNSDPANPTGPGRARNWCWDYAKQVLKTKRHWVMDDNIRDFFRLQENKKIRVADGTIFRVMEDFVDRYENVLVAGPNYSFFAAAKSARPAFTPNTRIYSTLLIDNDCPYRWRERYNEDTILALDVLTNGYCTIQFNAFLQGKVGTQTLKGGNTEVFYHAEGDGINEQGYNDTGTVKKSETLVLAYPKYCELVTRAGRVHHYVDYSSFRNNKLIRKPKQQRVVDPEYGMKKVKISE